MNRVEIMECIEEIYEQRHWQMTPEQLRRESALLVRRILAGMNTVDLRELLDNGGVLAEILRDDIEQYAIQVSKASGAKYAVRLAPAGMPWDYVVEFSGDFGGKPHSVSTYVTAEGNANWCAVIEEGIIKVQDWKGWKLSMLDAADWLAERRRDSVTDELEQMRSEVQS